MAVCCAPYTRLVDSQRKEKARRVTAGFSI